MTDDTASTGQQENRVIQTLVVLGASGDLAGRYQGGGLSVDAAALVRPFLPALCVAPCPFFAMLGSVSEEGKHSYKCRKLYPVTI